MHKFQPYELSELDFNPFNQIGQQWMLIAAGTKEKANAMTASWGGFGVIWGVNAATVYIRQTRYTKEFVDNNHYFTLNFFSEAYRKQLSYFGKFSGRTENKMEVAGMNFAYKNGIPYVDEANQVIICRKLSATDITVDQIFDKKIVEQNYPDDNIHTMYIGEIVMAMAR